MTPPRARTLGFLLLLAAFLTVDTLTQLAFKLAADAIGDLPLGLAFLRIAAGSGYVWLAAGLYGVTYVLWMLVLQRTPLSRAFPLTTLTYITVPAAAFLVFGETVGVIPMAGIALILAGVGLIGHEAPDPAVSPLPCAD